MLQRCALPAALPSPREAVGRGAPVSGGCSRPRAATSSTVVAEIADSASIIIFTRRVSGIASVGLNAIALVNETYT